MTAFSIPVDVRNPGQALACLGFHEAAEALGVPCESCFSRDGEADSFELRTASERSPFETAIDFLAGSRASAVTAEGRIYPAREEEKMALPVRVSGPDGPQVVLAHWADTDTKRESFKLYSGNRSAAQIVTNMIAGLRDLHGRSRDDLVRSPFDQFTSAGGTFNFDPRSVWLALSAGYSPNDVSHEVECAPAVEILAAWGLQNSRPQMVARRRVRYSIWLAPLPLPLARLALGAGLPACPTRVFRYHLALSGKNKINTFAQEETVL